MLDWITGRIYVYISICRSTAFIFFRTIFLCYINTFILDFSRTSHMMQELKTQIHLLLFSYSTLVESLRNKQLIVFYPSIFLTFFDSSGRVLILDTLTLFGIQHQTPNSRNPSIIYGCWFSISLTFKIIYTVNFQYELLSLNSLQRLFLFSVTT